MPGLGRAAICLLLAATSGTALAVGEQQAGAATPPAPPHAAPAQAPKSTPKPAVPRPAGRKVWTAQDLERLHDKGAAPINYLELPVPEAPETQAPTAVAGPQGVPERLQEMVTEAELNLHRLQRERLAASNPYLRGLAGGQPIRPVADIDGDLGKWQARLTQAQDALAIANDQPGPGP